MEERRRRRQAAYQARREGGTGERRPAEGRLHVNFYRRLTTIGRVYELTPLEMLVLWGLCDRDLANRGKPGLAVVGNDFLAAELQVSERTVKRAKARLAALQLIYLLDPHRGPGRAARYVIFWDRLRLAWETQARPAMEGQDGPINPAPAASLPTPAPTAEAATPSPTAPPEG